MDNFIKPVDALSKTINEQAKILFEKISDLPVRELNLPAVPLEYYINRHHERKFFSVQTAAEQLYKSLMLKAKPLNEVTVMEYGAGMGSLFLLAKMIGCKTVVYNDIMEDMAEAAQKISQFLRIPIDVFVVGDHEATLKQLERQGIQCDIILSRNVLEHIYDLNAFYSNMSAAQPNALIYFSTTANQKNPAMVLYHKRLHRKWEQQLVLKRKEMIVSAAPQINNESADLLATATRGLAMTDLEQAIERYIDTGKMPDPSLHYTNTCEPDTGNWIEHLIPIRDYKQIIESKGYTLTVLPAFWDTNYNSVFKRMVGKVMNVITRMLGPRGGLITTPFIYLIAEKK